MSRQTSNWARIGFGLMLSLFALLQPNGKVFAADERPKHDERKAEEKRKIDEKNRSLDGEKDKLVENERNKGDELKNNNELKNNGDLGRGREESLAKGPAEDRGKREEVKKIEDKQKVSDRGFQSEGDFEEHYKKHVERRGEFGKISREEYLRQAKDLRDRPADVRIGKEEDLRQARELHSRHEGGRETLEIHRGDDMISKYDRSTNSFGVYERDGSIVTFYKPEEHETYFWNQAEARKK